MSVRAVWVGAMSLIENSTDWAGDGLELDALWLDDSCVLVRKLECGQFS